jgi:hypothetical protein
MTTYHEMQEYVEITYRFVPHTFWIAEVKELSYPHLKEAANRLDLTLRIIALENIMVATIETAYFR